MADGSFRRIDEVKVGDLVMAADPQSGSPSPRKVTREWSHPETRALYRVSTGFGSVIATGAHPFWNSATRTWTEAKSLSPGDALQTRDGSHPKVSAVVEEYRGVANVYNLTVEGLHTYFVQFGHSAVLVHNCDLEPYNIGGGHHVPAKSAFRGDPAYNARTALSVPSRELERLGIDHAVVTSAQRRGYQWARASGDPLGWDDVARIEQAALEHGGASASTANSIVTRAIESLQGAGVQGPTRIPWGGM